MDRESLIQDIVENLTKCQRLGGFSGWKETGLSHAQIGMLFMLAYHKTSNVKQISEHLGVSKSAVTQLMEPLVSNGYVARKVDAKDRRIVHLSLTGDGVKILKKINKLKFAGLRTALGNLDNKELKHLSSLYQKMVVSQINK